MDKTPGLLGGAAKKVGRKQETAEDVELELGRSRALANERATIQVTQPDAQLEVPHGRVERQRDIPLQLIDERHMRM